MPDGVAPFAFGFDRLRSEVYQFSPPMHSGKAYRVDPEQSGNVTARLHANVIRLQDRL